MQDNCVLDVIRNPGVVFQVPGLFVVSFKHTGPPQSGSRSNMDRRGTRFGCLTQKGDRSTGENGLGDQLGPKPVGLLVCRHAQVASSGWTRSTCGMTGPGISKPSTRSPAMKRCVSNKALDDWHMIYNLL